MGYRQRDLIFNQMSGTWSDFQFKMSEAYHLNLSTWQITSSFLCNCSLLMVQEHQGCGVSCLCSGPVSLENTCNHHWSCDLLFGIIIAIVFVIVVSLLGQLGSARSASHQGQRIAVWGPGPAGCEAERAGYSASQVWCCHGRKTGKVHRF